MEKSINQIFNQALTAHQEGKLEEAERLYREILKVQPEHLDTNNNLAVILEHHNKLEEAEKYYRKAIELNPKIAESYNNLGATLGQLNRLIEAEASCKRAIELKPDYAMAYNNLGKILYKFNRFEEAEISYRRAVELKPNFADAYNNWGVSLFEYGKLKEAAEKYSKALIIEPKQLEAKENMISILDNLVIDKENNHPIVVANRNLQNIKNDFTFEKEIKKNEIANFFKDSNKVVKNNNPDLETNKTQIHRRNKIDLGCKRHKQLFQESNIIANACFSCFKIQIEPKNVLELFKLFFIFDKLVLPKNNSRKCGVELRPKFLGTYKGLIYCSNIEEINMILEIISPIINKLTKCKIKVIRGCLEYLDSFPKYREIDKNSPNFMLYNNSWKEIETFFDNKRNTKLKNQNKSLGGISISDILIMNNWLNYAKKIDDQSYKNISEDFIYSDQISKRLEKQLVKRKKEFLSQLELIN